MFLKYPSLVNHYNVNLTYVDKDAAVTVTEKIDGSNISLCAAPGEEVRWASRNHLVASDWNGVDQAVPVDVINRVIKYASKYNVQINLFGEIFSSNILKRIPYGNTKVRFYDVAFDRELVGQSTFRQFIKEIDLWDWIIPEVCVTSLTNALNLNVEDVKSIYADANIEGIVIKNLYDTGFNSRVFAIKKKSIAFTEKEHKPKPEKSVDVYPLLAQFSDYLNEQRVLSAISKRESVSMRDIGDLIKEVLSDAMVDFKLDTGLTDPVQEKALYKASGNIVAPIVIKQIRV